MKIKNIISLYVWKIIAALVWLAVFAGIFYSTGSVETAAVFSGLALLSASAVVMVAVRVSLLTTANAFNLVLDAPSISSLLLAVLLLMGVVLIAVTDSVSLKVPALASSMVGATAAVTAAVMLIDKFKGKRFEIFHYLVSALVQAAMMFVGISLMLNN